VTTFSALFVAVVAVLGIVVLPHGRSSGTPLWLPSSVGGEETVAVAPGTSAVAAGADGRTLYVGLFPEHGQGGVAVVDVSSRSVLHTVSLPSGVLDLAVDRTGSRVYATAADTNALEVIDPARGTLVRSIPVGSYPQGVALSPDGRTAYVVDYGGNAVSVVDLTAGQVVAKAATGTGPGDLAVSPDGSQVVVGNQNDDSITVIDTAVPTNPATVTVGEGAGHPAFSPDGRRLFVSLSNHGFGPFEVLELDPTSHETRSEGQLDHLVYSLTASNDHVYVGSVTPRSGPSFIDTLTSDAGSLSDEGQIAGKPQSVALSPDGRFLWIATGTSTVSARRVA
jgi:YVTN family beta-propeller protein